MSNLLLKLVPFPVIIRAGLKQKASIYCACRLYNHLQAVTVQNSNSSRPISTSPKQKDTGSIPLDTKAKESDTQTKEDDDDGYVTAKWRMDGRWVTRRNPKDWISFGYHPYDAEHDRWTHRYVMFFNISVAIFLAFAWYFRPNTGHEKDWVVREAHLELARREKYGLPLVDPDYIPAEKMMKQLPPDMDVDENDIII